MIVNKYNTGGGGSGSGSTDLTNYWNSAQTKTYADSAATMAYDSATTHIDDVELVVSSALNEFHTQIIELSGRTVDLSDYYTSAQTEEAITSKNYVTSGQVKDQVEAYEYVNSGQVETQILAKNYLTAEDIEPDLIYSGDPGFYAINSSALTTWQIENLDLSNYNFVRFYIKASDISFNSSDNFTAPMYVDVVLDPKSLSSQYQAYLGVTTNLCAGNRNRSFTTIAAVDITKSKVQVLFEVSLWDVSTSSAAANGRYCYKIEGYKYNVCGAAENGGGGEAYTAGANINISAGNVISVSGLSTINGSAITSGGNIVIQGGGAGNPNILAAITTDEEYEAISGTVKSGDLIQVYGVDINDDEEDEYGLFVAYVMEEEDPETGDITRTVDWTRVDNGNSVTWSEESYPWMVDNDVYPVDIGRGAFIISDVDADVETYNGIGFDGDGVPVISKFTPLYDDETGEVTGMTREDRDILGELDTMDEVVSDALNDLNGQIASAVMSQDIRNIVKIEQTAYDTLVAQSATSQTTLYVVVPDAQ